MTCESLVTQDWEGIVARLGGAAALEQSARGTKAFLRARAIATAVDLLRLILAYCLGERGLRSTAAWATAMGLADISNVALLQRLRRCGDWLALLVGEALAAAAPQASRGRLIRIIDATTVPKAGRAAKRGNKQVRSEPLAAPFGERVQRRVLQELRRRPFDKGVRRLAEPQAKLLDEARLADARLADDERELALASRRPLPPQAEEIELLLAPDERGEGAGAEAPPRRSHGPRGRV